MIRPCALQATLGFLLAPLVAHACPAQSLSCIPRYHLALDQETGGGFAITRGDPATAAIGVGLGADFFPLDNLSLGLQGALGAAHSSRPEYLGGPIQWRVEWDVGVRAGYNLPLSRRWSLWPRIGMEFDDAARTVTRSDAFGNPTVANVRYGTLSLELFAPVVVHRNAHFFVGFGPRVAVPVYVHAADTSHPLSASTVGLQLLIGGHF